MSYRHTPGTRDDTPMSQIPLNSECNRGTTLDTAHTLQ